VDKLSISDLLHGVIHFFYSFALKAKLPQYIEDWGVWVVVS